MSKNKEYLFPLITGLLAGAATVYFLKSEKGQKVIETALSKGSAIKESIVDNAQTILEKGHDVINEVIENNKEGVINAVEEVAEITEGKVSEFSVGVQTAKSNLNQIKVQ